MFIEWAQYFLLIEMQLDIYLKVNLININMPHRLFSH